MTAKIAIALATAADREEIYRVRHQVYALELHQHPARPEFQLRDSLDDYNLYLKATVCGRLAGFVSITPPGNPSYSVDKYFAREVFPFPFDDGLYEVRLLTTLPGYRRLAIAVLLMYAALRWIESRGGTRVVAIGRREVLSIYTKTGLQPLGKSTQSGAVTYELLTATVAGLRERSERYSKLLHWLEPKVDWQLSVPFEAPAACYHGGAFFEAIGEEFDHLERGRDVVNADVLDAWFPPSPQVASTISEHLPWLLSTSPPADAAGMVRAIARARQIPAECILPGAGSSELIFLAFREWLTTNSRILLLDPSYGEYSHIAENILRCRVDRLPLVRNDHYALRPSALKACLANAYDLVVIINPNSPTGQHVSRADMEAILTDLPSRTRVWLDETYVEYAGEGQSLEAYAARSQNVVVCKSMSKVYALSGARAAYLVAAPSVVRELREITPPWAVSLPAQVAAVKALADPGYYASRYQETHALRETLTASLRALRLDVIPSVANFLLCHLPPEAPDAATICERCRIRGVYLRDASEMGHQLGSHALRIAVKDRERNARIVETLEWALRESPGNPASTAPG